MKLGAKIKQLREANRWSQQELAQKSSLTRSHISQIENNKIPNPGVGAIISLATALKIDKDILLKAAGLKLEKTIEDPLASAIQNPEIRKWITAENINNLPFELQRAIAAVIKDFFVNNEDIFGEFQNEFIELGENQNEASRIHNPEFIDPNVDFDLGNSFKAKVDSYDELVNQILRLKNGASKVEDGIAIPGVGVIGTAFWPDNYQDEKLAQKNKEIIKNFELFFKKNTKEHWKTKLEEFWLHSLPAKPSINNTKSNSDLSVLRIDFNFTREDGAKTTLSYWFYGLVQFDLLKTMYQTGVLLPLGEPYSLTRPIPDIPSITLGKSSIDILGQYLADIARIFNLKEPELLSKYPPVKSGGISEAEASNIALFIGGNYESKVMVGIV